MCVSVCVCALYVSGLAANTQKLAPVLPSAIARLISYSQYFRAPTAEVCLLPMKPEMK